MVLKINNLRPVEITLPSFCCFVWQHIVWFMGLGISELGSMLPYLSHTQAHVVLALIGMLTAGIGFIKSQPQPQLDERTPRGAPVAPLASTGDS